MPSLFQYEHFISWSNDSSKNWEPNAFANVLSQIQQNHMSYFHQLGSCVSQADFEGLKRGESLFNGL